MIDEVKVDQDLYLTYKSIFETNNEDIFSQNHILIKEAKDSFLDL